MNDLQSVITSPAASVVSTATPGLAISEHTVLWLSILGTSGLALMWLAFWFAVTRSKESVHEILASPGFFRTVTVMGVVAATVVLSLAGRLEGNITGAILSGIVGYVLGQLSSKSHIAPASEKKVD